ncbi:N-hydroxycinnamoyl/benzoyltransferase [Trifolium pratense]|uniref:Uncharacterized protein n=2 Tax=Trifolium pratense TaxID=57577 RepID=A0ACB0I7L9_TRIPR|nr:N-hydroxycinnamoyl/benzoyltransferase [Trifolium pratense]CAJ2628075.1 unnamed protein product [Trifolium pratense]
MPKGQLIVISSGTTTTIHVPFLMWMKAVSILPFDLDLAGLLLAKDMNIDELVCYSDSLHSVNLIKGLHVKYHIHAVLIQDIKELLSQPNVSLYHTLREDNQCADFFAKLGASSDADYLIHASPPDGVRDLLRNDAMGTFFLRD